MVPDLVASFADEVSSGGGIKTHKTNAKEAIVNRVLSHSSGTCLQEASVSMEAPGGSGGGGGGAGKAIAAVADEDIVMLLNMFGRDVDVTSAQIKNNIIASREQPVRFL